MRKIIVNINLTLDGVMQAPGRADEDQRGGFPYGGWGGPYADPVMAEEAGKGMSQGADLLFGRRTYQDFYTAWHGRTDNPFSAFFDNNQKYVASRTLAEPLPWQNSTLLYGEAAQTVRELKETPGKDLLILGCGELVRSLMREGLIDEYDLSLYPLVLGTGTRLFEPGSPFEKLELVSCKPTSKGVILARYRMAG